jgi:multicomponent Na+:H+ antiporter subunit G
VREAVVVVLAAVGLIFSLSGALGVWRMPDLYSRVQASTKTITLGMLPALVALVVAQGFWTPFTARAVLVAFLVLTLNPAASHALSRAAYKTGTRQWAGAVADEGGTEESWR